MARGYQDSSVAFRIFIRNTIVMFLPLTVTLCSPVPGCVNRSTWMETSPTLPSCPSVVSESSNFCYIQNLRQMNMKASVVTYLVENTTFEFEAFILTYLKCYKYKVLQPGKYITIAYRVRI